MVKEGVGLRLVWLGFGEVLFGFYNKSVFQQKDVLFHANQSSSYESLYGSCICVIDIYCWLGLVLVGLCLFGKQK